MSNAPSGVDSSSTQPTAAPIARDDAEPGQPGPLAGELAAEAGDAADVPGPERDRVRDVRGQVP